MKPQLVQRSVFAAASAAITYFLFSLVLSLADPPPGVTVAERSDPNAVAAAAFVQPG